MFLSLTTTAEPATDLGFLLHKHPDRVQTFPLPVGAAHVFYPEAGAQRCTAALLLEVDPVDLVRGKRFDGDPTGLARYVNDRPYAASSMLAVALGRVFGTALRGECKARPELVTRPLPLVVDVPAVPVRGDSSLVRSLFEPLGWQVEDSVEPLDGAVPGWGGSPYHRVRLTGELTVAEALSHLYVLLPVLDGAKHYWVAGDEVDKLVRNAAGWLAAHPQRDLITRRYLAHRHRFVADATARLQELDDVPPDDVVAEPPDERPTPLRQHRQEAVLAALRDVAAHRVVDLGCGPGALLKLLLADPAFTEILGVDVSATELDRAERRLGLDRLPERARARITLRQSSLTYTDAALAGFDAAVLMEVVEHVEPDRLPSLERSVFGSAAPASVVVTTPNAEYNVLYPTLTADAMRHPDHRFEWTRAQFREWADRVAGEYGYGVEFRTVGEVDEGHGAPTQLALFRRAVA